MLGLTLGVFDVTCFDIARIRTLSLKKMQDFSIGNKKGVIRAPVFVSGLLRSVAKHASGCLGNETL